jgi:hypothetical protein
MKKIRIDPLNLIQSSSAPETRTAVTARQNNTDVGKCPVCAVDMIVVQAASVQTFVCKEHCVCLPCPDTA